MGVLSAYAAKSRNALPAPPTPRTLRPGADREAPPRRIWSGGATKEDARASARHPSQRGQDIATARLIKALRSNAPGGWTDNRMAQAADYTGVDYVAISNICKQLGRAEFRVYKKDPYAPDGKREVSPLDPPEGYHDGKPREVFPYHLVTLLEQPNRQDTFGTLMYQWGLQLRLTGSAITWLLPSLAGAPYEMYVLHTATVIPQPVINDEYPDGYYRVQPLYPYGPFSMAPTGNTSVGAIVDARWTFKLKYEHPFLRYDGYSPKTAMAQHGDVVKAIDRSRNYKMKRSINPSAVLQLDGMEEAQQLPDEEIERIKAEFENEQEGPENHGRLFVASAGGRLEEFGTRPVDMDYGAGWDQLTSFVMGGGYGITRPAAGMVEDSSYATLFATLKQLHLVTLEPECEYIGAMLTRHLAPYFGDDLIVEVKCKRIDDHEILFHRIGLAMDARAIKKNDLLKLLDLPTTTEPWGEDFAGDPSPYEMAQQQAQLQAQQAMLVAQAGDEEQAGGLQGEPSDEENPLPAEMVGPDTGDLGKGSAGPRGKALDYYRRRFANENHGRPHSGHTSGHHKNGRHAPAGG